MRVNWYECGQQAARAAKFRGVERPEWIPVCRKEYDDLRKIVSNKKNVDDYREFTHGFWNIMSDGEFYARP